MRGLLVSAALLAVAGCGASASPSPTLAPTASPADTPVATVAASPSAAPSTAPSPASSGAGSGIHIDLPSGWQQVQLTEQALTAEIGAIASANPDQAATLQQLLSSGAFKNFLFYAMDYDGLTNMGNLNVTTLQLGGMSLDAAQPVIQGEFQQLGATGVTFNHSTVNGVDSLVIDYQLSLNTAAGARTMTGRGYYIPSGDATYNVTTTCYGADTASCLADGDTMANGMTFAAP